MRANRMQGRHSTSSRIDTNMNTLIVRYRFYHTKAAGSLYLESNVSPARVHATFVREHGEETIPQMMQHLLVLCVVPSIHNHQPVFQTKRVPWLIAVDSCTHLAWRGQRTRAPFVECGRSPPSVQPSHNATRTHLIRIKSYCMSLQLNSIQHTPAPRSQSRRSP